jgi:hypothetical protein
MASEYVFVVAIKAAMRGLERYARGSAAPG